MELKSWKRILVLAVLALFGLGVGCWAMVKTDEEAPPTTKSAGEEKKAISSNSAVR
ncbi:MAG: hypothetical protein ACYTHN_23660 [Planctomycetota bacterium]|jgi:hypothetical protein